MSNQIAADVLKNALSLPTDQATKTWNAWRSENPGPLLIEGDPFFWGQRKERL